MVNDEVPCSSNGLDPLNVLGWHLNVETLPKLGPQLLELILTWIAIVTSSRHLVAVARKLPQNMSKTR
jgi:hypothetical protein